MNGDHTIEKARYEFPRPMALWEAFVLMEHGKLDHRDSVGRFVYATVSEKRSETNYKIHYDGWSRKWDTWSDFKKERHRFFRVGAVSRRPAHRFEQLKKGDYVDINPVLTHPGWKVGKIKRFDEKSGQVQVSYELGDKDYLYWTHLDNEQEIAEFASESGFIGSPKTNSLLNHRYDHLIAGYVTREILNEQSNDYPLDINSIIIHFLGDIFVIFDIYHTAHQQCIQKQGTIIKRAAGTYGIKGGAEYSSRWVYFSVGSSMEMDHGYYSFDIKCVEPNRYDAIGITSDLSICEERNMWFGDGTGHTYCYKGGGAIAGLASQIGIQSWEKNDLLSVKIDCEAWTVSFYRNGQLMGKAVDMEKNVKYHAFIGTAMNETEYHLFW